MIDGHPTSVVVTGCGAGIGAAIFERLARDGWAVTGVELSRQSADHARHMLRAGGYPGSVIEGDAADRRTLRSSMDAA